MVKLIDFHTHRTEGHQEHTFVLRNIIFPNEQATTEAPCTIGIHPWYLPPDQDEALSLLEEASAAPNVLAIGECGLDKNSSFPWALQVDYFLSQIQLANKLDKPLIIHCAKSYQECIELLQKSQNHVPVIFHGFAKSKALASQLLRKGYYLSLGGRILQGRHDDMLQILSLDKIFFETDDQCLEIGDIYSYFCRVKKMEAADLSKQICTNFHQVFGDNM